MFPAQLKGAFANWRVSATGIDDKLVRVLQGTNPRQPPVNFYFDDATGLLVRVLRFVDTAVGRVPFQVDYSDYRDVAGVKIPHKWILTWTNGQATSELTECRQTLRSMHRGLGGRLPRPSRSRLRRLRAKKSEKRQAPRWSTRALLNRQFLLARLRRAILQIHHPRWLATLRSPGADFLLRLRRANQQPGVAARTLANSLHRRTLKACEEIPVEQQTRLRRGIYVQSPQNKRRRRPGRRLLF